MMDRWSLPVHTYVRKSIRRCIVIEIDALLRVNAGVHASEPRACQHVHASAVVCAHGLMANNTVRAVIGDRCKDRDVIGDMFLDSTLRLFWATPTSTRVWDLFLRNPSMEPFFILSINRSLMHGLG
jgi:hypothetical protein